MENNAKGVEVTISGKLRGQRAKSMKFRDGYMIKAGEPKRMYVDKAIRHVLLRQGTLGIKVEIMLPHDPAGKVGPRIPLPDNIRIHEPKEEGTAPIKTYGKEGGASEGAGGSAV